MLYQKQRRSLQISVAVILLIAADSVAGQAPESFASNNLPTAVKKNIRTSENSEETRVSEKTVENYKRELLATPDNAALYNNLGTVYARLKQFDEAIAALEKSVALKPDFANAYYNLSIVYDSRKRFTEALAAIRKAVANDGQNVAYRTQLCQLHIATEEYSAAVPCYENLLKMTQPNVVTQISYGIALTKSDQKEKGFSVVKQGVEMFPDEPLALNIFGVMLFSKKKYKQAVEHFTRAVEISPEYDEARFNLAVAQTLSNDRTSALKQYNRLKNSDSKFAQPLFKFLYKDKVIYANK